MYSLRGRASGIGRETLTPFSSMAAVTPFVFMSVAILAQAGNMVITKMAISEGMNKYVLVFYSDLLSALILLPFCIFFHRLERPPLTSSILCKFFLLAVLGCCAQMFQYIGLEYSSPTMGTAMLNLIPAFTFIVAVLFRMERLEWRSSSTQAKVVGTLVSICGAFVVTFYKGLPIMNAHSSSPSLNQLRFSENIKWILGGFFLAGDALLSSGWYILQALILKYCPEIFLLTFYFIFLTILCTVFTLFAVQDPKQWIISFNTGLVAILYAGVANSALRISLTAWCLRRCGPLYVTMFKPLAIVFAVVMGVVLLGDALCLGSLIGAIIIVAGFYAVLWGKAKEKKSPEDPMPEISTLHDEKVTLLHTKMEGA